MCAQNHNKKSFSHVFPFLRLLVLMLLGVVFMVQGRAMEVGGKDKEQKSLLHTQKDQSSSIQYETVGISVGDSIEKRPYTWKFIEEVQYDPNLLVNTKSERAQQQILVIIDFISLSKNSKFFGKLKTKYQDNADNEQINIETLEALLKYLGGKSWKAIQEKPTLAMYLKDLREQRDEVIELVKRLLNERQLLRNQNKSQNDTIEDLLRQINSQQEDNENFSNENFQKPDNYQKYFIPSLTFFLGVSCTTIGFLSFYLYKQSH